MFAKPINKHYCNKIYNTLGSIWDWGRLFFLFITLKMRDSVGVLDLPSTTPIWSLGRETNNYAYNINAKEHLETLE